MVVQFTGQKVSMFLSINLSSRIFLLFILCAIGSLKEISREYRSRKVFNSE